jgi:hypothetical protein
MLQQPGSAFRPRAVPEDGNACPGRVFRLQCIQVVSCLLHNMVFAFEQRHLLSEQIFELFFCELEVRGQMHLLSFELSYVFSNLLTLLKLLAIKGLCFGDAMLLMHEGLFSMVSPRLHGLCDRGDWMRH